MRSNLLKKAIYSVPIKNQFEQFINAEYIKKFGFGEHHKKVEVQTMKSFLSKLNYYYENLDKTHIIGNKELFENVDLMILELVKK